MEKLMIYEGKTVLVTGCSGTIGSAIVRVLLEKENVQVVGCDINESGLFEQQLTHKGSNFQSFYCDIRDFQNTLNLLDGVDIVIHTAAMKHVTVSELSPSEAVYTNIVGVQNILNAIKQTKVELFVNTSSDKAVNPTNVMGATKLVGEKLVTAAARAQSNCKFISTRFGNVLGSRGSVIPIFKRQILNNEKLTLTDTRMTRFIMAEAEAVDLVLSSPLHCGSGDVCVTKMPAAYIKDIATAMLLNAGEDNLGFKIIGSKAGEKLYEELLTNEEMQRAENLEKYIILRPPGSKIDELRSVKQEYNSNNVEKLSIEKVLNYLTKFDLI